MSGVWALSVLVYRKRARVRQDAAIATNMASHPFISLLYYLYELDNNGHETWCTHVGSLLDGLRDVRDTQNIPPEVQNIEHLKFKMDTALEDKYIRGWTCQINNRNENPIPRIGAKFKSNFITKPYLTSLRVKRYQMNIARFRVNSHQLAIEKGRHQLHVIQPHGRLYHYCTKGKVDD